MRNSCGGRISYPIRAKTGRPPGAVEQALSAQGIDVFWDQETPPGVDWDIWIRGKLASAEVVVVLWSQDSIASPNVRHEAMVARDSGKLVPAMIEALSLSDYPMGLYLVQGVNLEDWCDATSEGMVQLVAQVQARMTRDTGAAPVPNVRPLTLTAPRTRGAQRVTPRNIDDYSRQADAAAEGDWDTAVTAREKLTAINPIRNARLVQRGRRPILLLAMIVSAVAALGVPCPLPRDSLSPWLRRSSMRW